MYAIQCVNQLYKYNRYVGLKTSGKPQLVYDSSYSYPNAIKSFKDRKAAEEFLRKILTRDGTDFQPVTIAEIVDFTLIANSTSFKIIECEIQDNELKIFKSYPFDTSKFIKDKS